MKTRQPTQFNGIAILAAMFREIRDPSFRNKLHKKLMSKSPILASLVEETEFLFSDLSRLDVSSTKKVLGMFPPKDWAAALRCADDQIKHHLLNQLPEGRKQTILDDLSLNQTRTKLIDSIKTQQSIAKTVSDQLKLGMLKLNSKRTIKKKA